MTTFDERESSFEAKFKHDKELQFKVNARRNKLLGLWAANLLGIHGAEAENYAKEVVKSDFATPGDHDVLHKVLRDFQAKKVEMSEHRLRKQMDDLMKIATDQIQNEVKEWRRFRRAHSFCHPGRAQREPGPIRPFHVTEASN